MTAADSPPKFNARAVWASMQELLSSMRFAVALLTVICIASVVGTVLRQHEPVNNYINQFGPFWAELFLALRLNSVYSAWWFLLILAFLVLSTTLCLIRHTPRYLADLRNYQENIRIQTLQSFSLRHSAPLNESAAAAAERISQHLARSGWAVKWQKREGGATPGHLLAARAGRSHKLGYIATHGAIVLICLGGLLDGDLIVRAQMWWQGKTPYVGTGRLADVGEQHRLAATNPTFRGNLIVAEGTASSTALLNQSNGVMLQELPFALELKKFTVDYYDSGMPKLFASDVVLHDLATGERHEHRIAVNHPASFGGMEIYQSSFEDGGSAVRLRAVPLHAAQVGETKVDFVPFSVQARVGEVAPLSPAARQILGGATLEIDDLRTINVENFSTVEPAPSLPNMPAAPTQAGQPTDGRLVQKPISGEVATPSGHTSVDARGVDFRSTIERHLGAGNKTADPKTLRNIGPSIGYKLRDTAGQAREYHNYMAPVDFGDGQHVFLFGVREKLDAPMRYLRLPADENLALDGFLRLKSALTQPALRAAAAAAYAEKALTEDGENTKNNKALTDPARAALRPALEKSALKALDIFAGVGTQELMQGLPAAATASANTLGGLQAIDRFLQRTVPEAEREQAAGILLRILNGTLFELTQISREKAGLPRLPSNAATLAFMTQAVFALSDAQFYPAPLAFVLEDFEQVQASVFQVARAPGKNIVYLGCALLVVGVFAMLYVRDRRLWIWLQDIDLKDNISPPHQATIQMAMSTNRAGRDVDESFALLRHTLLEESKKS